MGGGEEQWITFISVFLALAKESSSGGPGRWVFCMGPPAAVQESTCWAGGFPEHVFAPASPPDGEGLFLGWLLPWFPLLCP